MTESSQTEGPRAITATAPFPAIEAADVVAEKDHVALTLWGADRPLVIVELSVEAARSLATKLDNAADVMAIRDWRPQP